MQSFLENVLLQLEQKYDKIEDLTFVVPSKRASTFLKKHLASHLKAPIFSPSVYSIEEFVALIADLNYASNTEVLFELYNSYSQLPNKNKDDFNSFLKWGQTLLQDFNEINRYLVDETSLFSYLTSIQKLNQWGVSKEKTQLITNYLEFWKSLPDIYSKFNSRLLDNKKGYQGLVYLQAYKQVEAYIQSQDTNSYVFIGFNALNKAESSIIQKFLETTDTQIYFDIDAYFLEDKIHSASYFIRDYKSTWNYFRNTALKGITKNYNTEKNIQIIGVPKSVSQAKYAGDLLKRLYATNTKRLDKAALVLADENLLEPVLNALPKEIKQTNITMGLSIQGSSLAHLFEALIDLYINKSENGFFHKDLRRFLSNPYSASFLTTRNSNYAKILKLKILKNNWVFINEDHLSSVFPKENDLYHKLFKQSHTSSSLLKLIREVAEILKEDLIQKNEPFYLEQLYHIYKINNQIEEHIKSFDITIDLKTYKALFFELLSSESLDFTGNPTQGLQVMGMLETRVLDFDTVIITSVNEGILPSGKSNNSFVPYDVKREFELPTYKEKDAIYTYHFYRLLQRAKNVFLIYNTEPDVLEGGEKSRFINQLLTDENINKHITHTIASPNVKPNKVKDATVHKSPLLLEELKLVAAKGFSPSSLTNYIRNPLDFYRKSVLGIRISDEVEESIALNTFGTIIHDSLEDLYRPLVGHNLNLEALVALKKKTNETIKQNFIKSNPGANLTKGKNLISYNVIVKYITDFIDNEISLVKNHQIKIIAIEESMAIDLSISELDFPVVLKGKIDRIDMLDDQLRIIDYKTGKVELSELEIVDWQTIIQDKKYNKAFQLLCYGLMYTDKEKVASFEAGIIAIKKLSAGLLKFATKPSVRGPKSHQIDDKVLNQFKIELKNLVLEIFNAAIPFVEKEV